MRNILVLVLLFASGAAAAQTPAFGPTFADEVTAAGLGGLPLSWSDAGAIEGRERLTAAQRSALDAVIAAHVPTALRPNVISAPVFISRWTNAEYAGLMRARATAITNTSAGMALVKQWDAAIASGKVDLATAGAINFKASLVSAGILTQSRADAIFQ